MNVSVSNRQSLKRFKEELEAVEKSWKVMWQLARFFFYPRPGVQVLYLDAYTPGAYRAIVKLERRGDGKSMRP